MPEITCIGLTHEEFGKPDEVLHLQEMELASPESGEVLIEMEAAAIHPSDLGMIGGSYGQLRELPAVAGREGVGRVIEVGPGVEADWKGRLVRIPEEPGAWRTLQVARVEGLSMVPSKIPVDQAALAAINPTTAFRLLEDFCDLQEGDWIVQNAGNSAVGVAVIQLARSKGIHTASLVRREELFGPMRELGADLVLLDDRAAVDAIREATKGARVPLGLNSVGGSSVLTVAQSLSDEGTVVTFGGMTGEKIRFPTRQLIFNDISFRGFWMDRWKRSRTAEEWQQLLDRVYKAIEDGVIHTPVEKSFPLASFREALEANESGRMGKILFHNG